MMVCALWVATFGFMAAGFFYGPFWVHVGLMFSVVAAALTVVQDNRHTRSSIRAALREQRANLTQV